MEKQLLIENRNHLLTKLLWIFYMIHTIVYVVIDQQVDYISPFAGLLFLFPITFLSYKKKHPFLTMYATIIVYYGYITYLLVLEPLLVNLIFLLLGIILTIVYQQAKAIVVSSLLSLSLFIYFFTTQFDRLRSDLTRQDLIYFILFGLLAAILFLYYTKILNDLWTAVHLKAKKTEEELHSTQEYLQSFFTFNNDAIAVIDLEGKVITVNPAFERIYGWKKDEIIGMSIPFVPSHLKKGAYERFKKVCEGEQIIGFETQDLCKDGRTIEVEITISPIYDSKGNVIALSEISRDITEKKATDELLRQADKLSLAGEMAAGVAHEIRNPLTSLNGFIQLIHEDSEKYHSYTNVMLSELNRLNAIIGEFLMLAKPQSMYFAPHSFHDILREVILLFETECTLKNVVIGLNLPADSCILLCDNNQLKQVFINLLKNAIEAMPQGGSIHIDAAKKDDQHMEILIRDTGSGIPPSILEHIQRPFFTTKESGTGLGLVVTQKIICRHQGDILISSEQNQGTTVTLTLPLYTEKSVHA
ncbi:ATP-binding protein [Bacillus songklensis]|uniref:histidine kinase n=1 Tax=Bacillus songklensis TaxID=1069116 RepID=A0ABV8B0F4_9BACI